MMIEERSGSEERAILTGMLTNRQVCARLAQSWTSEGLFRSRYANLVAGWAVAHFNKYGDAIGPQIELQLATYASQTADKETLALVESLVAGLSNDWQGGNVSADYLLDIAQKYTAGVAAERAILQAQQDIKLGNVDEAISRLSRLSSPIVSSQQWIDPFTDREAMRKAWETSNDPLIVFPGPIGELFKNAFRRDSFIAFRAVAKAGKSFNLLELAYRAVLQGRRVAYFCIGDMSEAQVLQRLGQRVAKRPLYAGDYSLPSGWDAESPTPFPILKPHHYETDLTWEEAANAGERFIAKVSESGENLCRLSVHASGGLNTIGLNGLLTQWAIEGFPVDVVLVDYADLLGDIPGTDSRRESIEESWRQMRAISQRFHLCLATATQSNREGYNKELLDMDNFNGSRTQNDNVTAIYSINQTTEESAIGIQRIQAIANRDNPDKRVVACLGARSVACPIMFSMFCEAEEAPKDKKPKRKAPAS